MTESPVRLYLRKIREDRGLTHQDLADKTGTTQGYISQIEHGLRTPSLPMLARLAEALGVQIRDLLDERPCPDCPYWEQVHLHLQACLPQSPALDAARKAQRALVSALPRRTAWLSALGTSGILTAWIIG